MHCMGSQRLEEEYTRRLSDVPKGEGWQSLKQLQSLIQKVKRGTGRLVDVYTEGLIERDEFEPRIRQAKARLAQLEHHALTGERHKSHPRHYTQCWLPM